MTTPNITSDMRYQVSGARPATPLGKTDVSQDFQNFLENLLKVLAPNLGNVSHPKFNVSGNTTTRGQGSFQTSTQIASNVNLRYLQTNSANRTDMRSIVTKKLADGTTLSVTSANQINKKGEKTAQWYRYAQQSTLTDLNEIKKLNLKNVDLNQPVKEELSYRVLKDPKGKVLGYEYSQTISFKDNKGVDHTQTITQKMDADGNVTGFTKKIDGGEAKPFTPSEQEGKDLTNMLNQKMQGMYSAHEADFDQLYEYGDYGLNDDDPSAESAGGDLLCDLLKELANIFLTSSQAGSSYSQNIDILAFIKSLGQPIAAYAQNPMSNPVKPSAL